MRKYTEFKGYVSSIEYDAETGSFVSRKIPDDIELGVDNTANVEKAEILPFPVSETPQPVPEKQNARMVG